MSENNTTVIFIDSLYREQSRRIYATLCRLLGDMDLAEESMHEAFHIALSEWQASGIPANPRAWLISTARFKAIDHLRRLKRRDELLLQFAEPDAIEGIAEDVIEDDQLRLIFTCCHPVLDLKVQIPLTLREVCGLTTEAIASAFLVSPATMAQRIVRGKAKIRNAQVPFDIPEVSELPQRLDAVLTVIYLVFNEGYNRSSGEAAVDINLIEEALRLAQWVQRLLPDSEVQGLIALMLLHESRREARIDSAGDIVLLEHQDRSRWNTELIKQGCALVEQALATKDFGFYTVQAAISAKHALAPSWESTPWSEVVTLYDLLARIDTSPVIRLNRAVAVAMRDGPEAGLALILPLLKEKSLKDYHLLYAAYGELLAKAGRPTEAARAFEQALSLTQQAPEQRVLQAKIAALTKGTSG